MTWVSNMFLLIDKTIIGVENTHFIMGNYLNFQFLALKLGLKRVEDV